MSKESGIDLRAFEVAGLAVGTASFAAFLASGELPFLLGALGAAPAALHVGSDVLLEALTEIDVAQANRK